MQKTNSISLKSWKKPDDYFQVLDILETVTPLFRLYSASCVLHSWCSTRRCLPITDTEKLKLEFKKHVEMCGHGVKTKGEKSGLKHA